MSLQAQTVWAIAIFVVSWKNPDYFLIKIDQSLVYSSF